MFAQITCTRLPLVALFATAMVLPAASARAQRTVDSLSALSGTIAADFLVSPPATPVEEQPALAPVSVPLAATLSAILPGAGQVYARAPLWRTALYAGIEALAWTAYGVTSARGSALTTEFEQFADEHWRVSRYIDWLASNYHRWPDSAVNKQAAAEALQSIYTSTDQSRPDWERVDFEQLNRLERAVSGGFSHTLPSHGHQQYYEQIGKYVQYRAGWDDHALEGDTIIYDPSRVTGRNLAYMDKRADANTYLSYASTALGGVLLNHLASLVDAALAARGYNASIHAEIKGDLLGDTGEPLYAALDLTIRF
jgi:hypothetical protein